MCRNIRPLFNYDPPATESDVHEASLQFIRKVSGFQKPSKVNEAVFNQAVGEVSLAVQRLMTSLITEAPPRDRATEIARAHEKSLQRFGH